MPVTVKVNGAANTLVHKGSNGVSVATIPDVCKTPSPGGPVPIPYPNISQSATLAKGTTTVKADGGMMIAIKGSEFSLSNGDNAGVAGGVKSSTFMKESTWILYSFDVKMDGKNACRLTDKKFQNHENTVDMAGTIQVPNMPNATPEEFLREIACRCDKVKKNTYKKNGKPMRCSQQGVEKHACCEDALQKHAATGRTPKVGGEKGYYGNSGRAIPPPNRAARFVQGTIPGGSSWPDAAALGPGGKPEQFFDFKFKCRHSKKKNRYKGPPTWNTSAGNAKQLKKLQKLSAQKGINPTTHPPTIVHNFNCR
jgi:hypothetical protein